jgi:deazaflavin-dependent oxidoreductase (nitroreductase family)
MDEKVSDSLLLGGVIDITRTGRKTGEPRRTEIRIHTVDGQLYLSGAPGKRDWYANMLANPQFQVHLKRDVYADLEAFALRVREDRQRKGCSESCSRTPAISSSSRTA